MNHMVIQCVWGMDGLHLKNNGYIIYKNDNTLNVTVYLDYNYNNTNEKNIGLYTTW